MTARLYKQMGEVKDLDTTIRRNLEELGNGE